MKMASLPASSLPLLYRYAIDDVDDVYIDVDDVDDFTSD
jgi:hypothetical protein